MIVDFVHPCSNRDSKKNTSRILLVIINIQSSVECG
jgi:hypothetical protein